MRAVAFTETGAPEVLQVMEVPEPLPAAGQVRMRVTTSGVNFRDVMVRRSGYAEGSCVPQPVVTGIEAAGTIEALGEGVRQLHVGQRVATICPGGGYGDLVVVPATRVIPLPDTVSDVVGGGFAMTGCTAWHLLHTVAHVQPGDTVLVHAAAGGVGVMLCQLAKRCGATVIGTVGADEKAETAGRFGVDHVINYRRDNFAKATLALTGGRGVDAIFDAVGSTTATDDIQALKVFGILVSFGRAAGLAQLGASELSTKSLRWAWFGIFHAWNQLDVWARGVSGLLPLIASGAVDPYITATYPWEQAAEAHRRLERRDTQGKLVLYHTA